jgi:tRNA(fMet)-specific endonuclease VapC
MKRSPLKYLLDTNIISDLIRNPQGEVTTHIARVGEKRICTSIIVACELRYGAAKRASSRLTERVEQVLSALHILPLGAGAERIYAEIRVALESTGMPVGANDLLIAAHARTHRLTLVTANEREFRRVPNLTVANWL